MSVKRRVILKRLIVLAVVVSVFCSSCIYFSIYYRARTSGLFLGGVETFVPYGGQPSGRYEIKPIGYLSLTYSPELYSSEEEREAALKELRAEQAESRRLWPYYSWLAQIEELFH